MPKRKLLATTAVLASTLAAAWGGWLPGEETNDRAKLDPVFATHVEAIVAGLRAEGHDPRDAATYRDPERQDFIYDVGQLLEMFGARPMTRARGGRSCHNNRALTGDAAALAADIVPGPDLTTAAQKAAFFHALGKAAKARGLGWGGDWARKNPDWKKHGLGWDPAHVQSPRCRW